MFTVACDDARPPTNGSVEQQTDGIVTKSVFSCDVGFSLNGHVELSCLEDGSWNSSFPFCGKYIYRSFASLCIVYFWAVDNFTCFCSAERKKTKKCYVTDYHRFEDDEK